MEHEDKKQMFLIAECIVFQIATEFAAIWFIGGLDANIPRDWAHPEAHYVWKLILASCVPFLTEFYAGIRQTNFAPSRSFIR
jgi:hypothetical protein